MNDTKRLKQNWNAAQTLTKGVFTAPYEWRKPIAFKMLLGVRQSAKVTSKPFNTKIWNPHDAKPMCETRIIIITRPIHRIHTHRHSLKIHVEHTPTPSPTPTVINTHTPTHPHSVPHCTHIYTETHLGLAKTVYTHRIWPHIWWFPCQKCRIYYTPYVYVHRKYIYLNLANSGLTALSRPMEKSRTIVWCVEDRNSVATSLCCWSPQRKRTPYSRVPPTCSFTHLCVHVCVCVCCACKCVCICVCCVCRCVCICVCCVCRCVYKYMCPVCICRCVCVFVCMCVLQVCVCCVGHECMDWSVWIRFGAKNWTCTRP